MIFFVSLRSVLATSNNLDRLESRKTFEKTTYTSMKKATVGLVMLVSLVLTKAYISKDQQDNTMLLRSNAETAFIIESSNLRADLYSGGSSQVSYLAQNINHPEPIIQFVEEVSTNLVSEPVVLEDINVIESIELNVAQVEEIVPMDNITNTGYGLLKTTTEQIISKKDRVGKEPLDNSSNTISDNISKMFPREQ